MVNNFEFISHMADVQMRVHGLTQQDLFIHALQGMFQLMEPSFSESGVKSERVVDITAGDPASLLVDFLSEALCLADTYNEAYQSVTLREFTPTHIKAILHGVAITRCNGVEVKAVTYHGLHIKQIDGKWQVAIVFDI